ncbi:16S rRNA (adenine(1518)-N(6)/adenine(1519)-N(6))-dimethyltransferase RsmA [Spiribacter halobius]|uniref:Ribosomal RNA small subunit methyltransferase A n=1 Tax=Sediminicurvatus halobius TaxID=2182432 RepID=A0A2U2N7S8_9GAMM|nr:16S rRNA (adenine(1518)-N(6)/adenine(1519)-N(6))-dimethyltransferase RsmA [Spiribacter halobius]PWG65251.1 16S rRNA (adenine(1518)-N(6)/adenine(1519)-N(6))-dimethyltransferase [Spiribacter halobius]UEX78793.1 16S rRNA (adenine(1518)-N(6)/adenine(1519)-N(6))-dimethyltransferase RsmA [Spiribacter halobius]
MAHRPRRRFGQNFLHDPGVLRRMVAAINPTPGDAFLEIGPGQGALTLPLLERAGALTAIELDRDLIEHLRTAAADRGALTLHAGDALGYPVAELAPADGRRLRIVGNLPYNLSTPLLFHLTASPLLVTDLHLLLQREVVTRMAAGPGGRDYGRLSVMLQYRCRVIPLFDIGPGAFRPPPRVTSTFVRLVPHSEPPVVVPDEAALGRVVAAAFAARRKTLRNSLGALLPAERIAAAGIDPGTRAERLSLEDFAALARALPGAATS